MSSDSFLEIDDQDESVVNKKQYSVIKSFLFLYRFTVNYRKFLFLSFSMLVFYSVLSMVSGHFIGRLVGDALAKQKWQLAIEFSAIVLGAELTALIVHYFGRKILAKNSSFVILNIRKKLFDKLSYLPMSFYDRWPQGRIVTRLTHDVEGVEQFFTESLGRFLTATFMACASIIAMLVTDFRIGIILVISMLPALIIVLITREKVGVLSRAISKKSSQVNSRLSEFVDGIFVIRSFALEGWSHEIFTESVEEYVDASLDANKFYSWSRPLVSFLCGLPILLLLWFGGTKVIAGTMSLAVFVAFIRYCERFFFPVLMLFREIHVIIQAFTNAQRVANFLASEEENEKFTHNGKFHKHEIKGEIQFKDVWMGYNDDQYAIKGLNLEVHKGQKVGIVGSTGSGKTTVISILSRLYDFQKGDIRIDDVSLRDWDIYELRSQIGLVSQDVTIFQGTLRENLTVDPDISDEKIMDIASHTGLEKVMDRSGLTLNSKIYDGGANLSAGEKQVISLTRICLLDPHILILDEATANVDPYYEAILHDAIEYLMKGKTSFIIAHRLDTISECDRILVFDHGELVEDGGPDELLAQKGKFYNLSKSTRASTLT